jgi:hypothetical protein
MAATTRALARAAAEHDLGLRVTPARERADERPALRVVPATRRRRWGIAATLACAAIFAVMLGLTTFQARIAADQLQIDQLDGQVTDAQSRYEQLRLEVARLESPTRIVTAAYNWAWVQPEQSIYVTRRRRRRHRNQGHRRHEHRGRRQQFQRGPRRLGDHEVHRRRHAMTTRTPPARPAPARRAAAASGRPRRIAARRPKSMRPRLIAFFVVVLIVIVVVVVRVGALQTLDAKQLSAYGATQRRDREVLPAARGIIFDRNHEELALSVARPSVWADPRAIADKSGTALALASVLQLSPSDMASLRDRLDSNSEFVYVGAHRRAAQSRTLSPPSLKGVYFVDEPKRFLPADSLAKGVIGSTDAFGVGASGLEKQYNEVLTGTPGQLLREQDSRGRTIPQGDHDVVPAQPGDDLVLTLDRTLQYFTEQQLLQRVRETGAKGGMVVVLDSKSGDVLAMASVKTDLTTGVPAIASYNAAVVDTYEPGSVAKIITASAALQEGTIMPISSSPFRGS